VFDPVDGTTNYAHGLPIFCSSLALEIDGVPAVGAVYDPSRRELFTAERGQGAWLNGVPLRVSPARHADRLAALYRVSLHGAADPSRLVGLFSEFLTISRAVRRLGSAALDLCYVAAGRLDGFWEQKLNPWDTAAGALIVEEAGGRVTGLLGEPYRSRDGHIVASNGRIHDEMVATIAGFFARSQKGTG
jgi:myo-inositol-1(or 4)-monophosphatase